MHHVTKLKQLTVALATVLASTATLGQTIAGDSTLASGTAKYVRTGPSNAPGMATGKAGISMPRSSTIDPTDQSYVVGFAAGPVAQTNAKLGGGYGNDFLTKPGGTGLISEAWKYAGPSSTDIYAYRQISDPVQGYPFFGGEVFGKVPGQEVYFGEWAPPGNNRGTSHDPNLNMSSALRTVFYVGENPTTSMPTLTNAQYDVVGIRQYNPDTHSGLYSGVLTANYGAGSGTLAGTVGYVNFNGTTIAANGTFNKNFASGATINGRFYGAAAEALAGIYDQANNVSNDMAFGGAKR